MTHLSGNPTPGKRKQPCTSPGCDHPNWHVCPKRMGPDTFPDLLGTRRPGTRVAADLADWGSQRGKNAARDIEIVRLYAKRNMSMQKIADELNMTKDAVLKILHDASNAGVVSIRKIGRPASNFA